MKLGPSARVFSCSLLPCLASVLCACICCCSPVCVGATFRARSWGPCMGTLALLLPSPSPPLISVVVSVLHSFTHSEWDYVLFPPRSYLGLLFMDGNMWGSTIMLMAWVACCFYVRTAPGMQYAGVVAAFTAPIVMIQNVENVDDKRTAALSRIEQTIIATFVVAVVVTIMWPNTSRSSHQVRPRLSKAVDALGDSISNAVKVFAVRASHGDLLGRSVVASQTIADTLNIPASAVQTTQLLGAVKGLQKLVSDANTEPTCSSNNFPCVASHACSAMHTLAHS